MGDPREMGAQIRMGLPGLTGLQAKVDVGLCSTAQNTPPGKNAAARLAQRNLSDAPFATVVQRDRIPADQTLARSTGAVQSKRQA